MVPPIQTANVEQHLQNPYSQYHDLPYGMEDEAFNRGSRKFIKTKEIRHHESSVTSHAYHHSTPDGLALSSSRGDGGGYQNRSGLLDIIQEEGARKVASYDSDTQRRRPLNRPNPNEDLCFMCGQDLLDDDASYTLTTTRRGVDAEVQRQSVHVDCFQCATCGLKFDENATEMFALMDEKLYCEMHAEQRRRVFGAASQARNNNYKNSSAGGCGTAGGGTFSPTNPPTLSADRTADQRQQGEKRQLERPQQFDGDYRYCENRKGWNGGDDNDLKRNQPPKIKKYVGIENRNKNLPPSVAPSFKRVFIDAPNVPPMARDERTMLKETLQSSTFIQDLRRNLENCQKAIKENRSPVTSNRRVAFSDVLQCQDDGETVSGATRPQPIIGKSNGDPKKSTNYVRTVNHGGSNDRLVCESCRETIRGPHVLASGKYWCADHFSCANPACARPLVNCPFIECGGTEESGEAGGSRNYCESCYETLVAPICTKCGLPIVSDCLNAMKKKWHPGCFICTHCRRPFAQNQDGAVVGGRNLSFYVEDNRPYCESDWNELFTQKCAKCTRPVQAGESFIEALGYTFHSKCFRCEECSAGLSGRTFFAHNNRPYCRNHCKV